MTASNGQSNLFLMPSVSPVISIPYRDRHFTTIFFISNVNHLDGLSSKKEDSLFVTDDWLLWQQLAADGYAAVSIEIGLTHAPNELISSDIFIQSNNWLYDGNQDVTIFRNTSLGKQFIRETSRARLCAIRLKYALEWLFRIYTPKTVVVYGLKLEEFDHGSALTQVILESLARDYSIKLKIDQAWTNDSGERADRPYPLHRVGTQHDKKGHLRDIYSIIIDAVFRMKCFLSKKKKTDIMIFPVGSMLQGFLRSRSEDLVQSIFPAERLPKSLSFLLSCWCKGHRLVRLGRPKKLNAKDKKILEDMKIRLEKLNSDHVQYIEKAVWVYIRDEILRTHRLEELAANVKSVEAFFNRNPTLSHLVMSGCAFHPETRPYAELARLRGIPVDEVLHGMRISTFPYEPLCGDPHSSALLTRILAWGEQNKRWSERIGARCSCTIIGHPAYNYFPPIPEVPRGRDISILFLPEIFQDEDWHVLSSDCYEHLVSTLKFLGDAGYKNITTKLHPGLNKNNYYRTIFEKFQLPGTLETGNNFLYHLESADLVIGPVWSSAMFETLAAGKPYIPSLLPGSIACADLVAPIKPIRTTKDLEAALEGKFEQDWPAILASFCGYPTEGDPIRKFWSALDP